ncbi:MAG TPA: neutral zinc metallopeptidase, partial [Turneriella sp.]|nr:neutral zinc metallopeptidase [Turneriella sp.]
MRDDGRESSNVEDRRGGGGGSGLGGLGGLLLGGMRGKSIGVILVVAAAAYFFDIDPTLIMRLLGGGEGTMTESSAPVQQIPANDKLAKFVSVVLADTEDVWRERFQAIGKEYRDPKLVLFRGSTPTPCGKGKSAMGPFYCPADQKVYIDLTFYQELKSSYRAPGDFAQAYVIGHEVGHHVQNLLGTMRKVRQQQEGASENTANALSVKLELQADCYAGVWAHHAHKQRQILEEGD